MYLHVCVLSVWIVVCVNEIVRLSQNIVYYSTICQVSELFSSIVFAFPIIRKQFLQTVTVELSVQTFSTHSVDTFTLLPSNRRQIQKGSTTTAWFQFSWNAYTNTAQTLKLQYITINKYQICLQGVTKTIHPDITAQLSPCQIFVDFFILCLLANCIVACLLIFLLVLFSF